MPYADDAGISSKSEEGLAKMMAIVVTVFDAAGLSVSEKKADTMLLQTRDHPGLHRSSSKQREV